jgi:hypothetical protein
MKKKVLQAQSCRERQHTRFMFPQIFSTNCAAYGIMWKNMVEWDKTNIVGRMPFALWVTKAEDRHSEYVILIAISRQYWSRERA